MGRIKSTDRKLNEKSGKVPPKIIKTEAEAEPIVPSTTPEKDEITQTLENVSDRFLNVIEHADRFLNSPVLEVLSRCNCREIRRKQLDARSKSTNTALVKKKHSQATNTTLVKKTSVQVQTRVRTRNFYCQTDPLPDLKPEHRKILIKAQNKVLSQTQTIKEQTALITDLKKQLEAEKKFERKYRTLKTKKAELEKTVEEVTNEKKVETTKLIKTQLQYEAANLRTDKLNSEILKLKMQIGNYKKIIMEKEATIAGKDVAIEQQKSNVLDEKHTIMEKNVELITIKKQIELTTDENKRLTTDLLTLKTDYNRALVEKELEEAKRLAITCSRCQEKKKKYLENRRKSRIEEMRQKADSETPSPIKAPPSPDPKSTKVAKKRKWLQTRSQRDQKSNKKGRVLTAEDLGDYSPSTGEDDQAVVRTEDTPYSPQYENVTSESDTSLHAISVLPSVVGERYEKARRGTT